MKFKKLFGLTIFVLAMLLLAGGVVASQGSANSAKAKAKADKTEQKDKTPISVPEPATIVLMGAAAAVAGVRKVWQDRRRSKSV